MQPGGHVNGVGFTIVDRYRINGCSFYTIRYTNGILQQIPEQVMYDHASDAIQKYLRRQK